MAKLHEHLDRKTEQEYFIRLGKTGQAVGTTLQTVG